jgi:Tfp pilus assembly protein PilF
MIAASGMCWIAFAFAGTSFQDESKRDKADEGKAAVRPADKAAATPPARVSPDTVPECQQAQKKFRDGDLNEAKKLLDSAAAKHPELPPSQVMMAALLLTGNRVAEGRGALERAAIERPEHPEVNRHFGELALAENRLCDAEVQFDRAAQLAGNESWSLKQRQQFLSQAYAGLAAVAERRQDWNAAFAKLYLLRELEKDNPRVRWRLGRAQFYKGKPDDAQTLFQSAWQADNTLEPAELTMGALWAQKKEFAKAEKLLAEAVKTHPKDARTHAGLADFFLQQSRLNEARTAARAGMQADPNHLQLRLLDAVIARASGELDYAERALQELVAKHPSDFGSTNQLALVLSDQEEPRKKAQGLDIATNNQKLYPNNIEALTTLGWAMYRNGLLDRAEQALHSAVRTNQGSSDCAYYLAVVWMERGKRDDAKKLLEMALAAPGTFVHRKDCQELLAKANEKKP